MPKLNRIYTKTGDAGRSALSNGERRSKTDLRFAVCGDIDEANAYLGLAATLVLETSETNRQMKQLIERLQQEMFTLGCDVASPSSMEKTLRVPVSWVLALEHVIDEQQENLGPLENFILPGGNTLASYLHLARCVVRRSERMAWQLQEAEECSEVALQYINRLSDLLFVLARTANAGNDVLWQIPNEAASNG